MCSLRKTFQQKSRTQYQLRHWHLSLSSTAATSSSYSELLLMTRIIPAEKEHNRKTYPSTYTCVCICICRIRGGFQPLNLSKIFGRKGHIFASHELKYNKKYIDLYPKVFIFFDHLNYVK